VPGGYLWALIATVGIGALLVQPRSSRWLLQKVGKVEAPQLRYSQLMFWLFFYIIAWIGSGLIFYLLAYAFTGLGSEHLPYAIGAWALVGALSTLVFFLPSNFGFTEIGLTLLMAAVMPMPVAVVLALTVRVTLTAFDLLAVGLWFGGGAIWRRVNSDINLRLPPINED
jgi:fatty acid desaturase